MKTILKYTIAIFLSVIFLGQVNSQDNRTSTTKIADILAQFPTKDYSHSDKLMAEILEQGADVVSEFCSMIVPPGTGDDTQARYALESVSRYSGAPGRENEAQVVEKELLKAIEIATNKEVQAFFIRRLVYCGGDNSVLSLENYLLDEKLFSSVLNVLSTVGTKDAGMVILKNLDNANAKQKVSFIKALGEIKYKPAEKDLIAVSEKTKGELRRQSLYALANIGQPSSEVVIAKAAKEAKYLANSEETMISYIQFSQELAGNGFVELSNKLSLELLRKCKSENQLHYRSAALSVLRANMGAASTPILLKEIKNDDKAFRNAVLLNAVDGINSEEVKSWIQTSKKFPSETKVQLIYSFAKISDKQVLDDLIMPGLNDESIDVRIEAIQALAINQQNMAVPVLQNILMNAKTEDERLAIKKALQETSGTEDIKSLVKRFKKADDNRKCIIIDIVSTKRATEYFYLVLENTASGNAILSSKSYLALQFVSESENLGQLLELLSKTTNEKQIADVQNAIIAVIADGNEKSAQMVLNQFENSEHKEKITPILPFLNSDKALNSVISLIENGSQGERNAAFEAISNWKNSSAIPHLYKIISSNRYDSFHSKAFESYLAQVRNADITEDQKLLLVRKLMPEAKNVAEEKLILRSAAGIKTFLSFVFVSEYIDSDDIGANAAFSAMQIMLPSPGKKDGLYGDFVKEVTVKILQKLSGPDSQYSRIDIQEYLDKMPAEAGYLSIFNGEDLSGWQGLVKNPIARSKMTEEELAKEQLIANEKMKENWSVKDGAIWFSGKGQNLCSKMKYGDFDMLVDWKITKHGDSGLYLRGTPQVQIWDTSRVEVGAEVGSGGLYNNKVNESKPLVLADNAIGDWNTFRIKMIGDKVTVYLNGQLVVDNVTMENYWDRSLPIFPEEAIELQAHGTDLAFRNLYVREINSGSTQLPEEEIADGFASLFNGVDLDYWMGNKTDYIVEDNTIAVRPKQGGHGNLYTVKEYSNFIFRFEFQLTPGANNGLGIHSPLEGDVAYDGKELQILDNTAAIYAELEPYQYHGSVYGILAAKRGFLKPVGEWNCQEVIVKGDDIKVTLNGEVILDGNIKEASKNGTVDKNNHPGLNKHKGHISFLGHGSDLQFRNLRIKEL